MLSQVRFAWCWQLENMHSLWSWLLVGKFTRSVATHAYLPSPSQYQPHAVLR
jgi:hypothetical protein